jgi:hypothetical protein
LALQQRMLGVADRFIQHPSRGQSPDGFPTLPRM